MVRRFILLLAAAIAVATLAAFIKPEQAIAQRSVAATAVQHCRIVAANSHRSGGARVLSSVKLGRAEHICTKVRKSVGVIRFWMNPKHRWTLYLNQKDKKCWRVRLEGPERLCMTARASVRTHTRVLVRLDARIKKLLPQPQVERDWLYQTFLCIHGGEGAWDAISNTTPTYYGGLQMDMTFMRTYGPEYLARWGTADHWPPWAQIVVAERAYRAGRGFGPWPNTAPPCMSGYDT